MGETNWVDIFRAGDWTDMNGKKASFTVHDLDAMVSSFAHGQRRVPLVIGHPATNDPAYGWVAALRRVGDVLQAKFRDVSEAMRQLVTEGRFRNVSVSLFGDGGLRHVGLLGAMQPAVSGLEEVSFQDGEEALSFEFISPSRGAAVELETLKRQLDHAYEKLDQEKAKSADFAAQVRAASRRQMEDRLDGLIKDAFILPAERPLILAMVEALEGSGQTFQFAESGRQEPVTGALWKLLEGRGRHNLFQEFATADRVGDGKAAETAEAASERLRRI